MYSLKCSGESMGPTCIPRSSAKPITSAPARSMWLRTSPALNVSIMSISLSSRGSLSAMSKSTLSYPRMSVSLRKVCPCPISPRRRPIACGLFSNAFQSTEPQCVKRFGSGGWYASKSSHDASGCFVTTPTIPSSDVSHTHPHESTNGLPARAMDGCSGANGRGGASKSGNRNGCDCISSHSVSCG